MHAKVMLCKEKTGILGIHTFPEAKFRVIVRSFALDLSASKIAELSDVSRPTINQLLLTLRIRVAQVCDASSPFSGEWEKIHSKVI